MVSERVAPVMATVAVPVPELVSVIVCEALVAPTAVAAKVRPEAESEMAGVPVDVVTTALPPEPPQPESARQRRKTGRGREGVERGN